MNPIASILPDSPRRQMPEAIGIEPGDRYTHLLHRTRSRPSSRPRRSSLTGRTRGNGHNPVPAGDNESVMLSSMAESSYFSGDRDGNSVPVSHSLDVNEQPVHFSLLPFGPSRRRSSLATNSTSISTPPPMYTGYGTSKAPATEPIPQHAQFNTFLQVGEHGQGQSLNPFSVPDSGLRQRNPYSAYYTSPIVPPQPSVGAGSSIEGFGMHRYAPGRTSMIQPHHLQDWEDEDEEPHSSRYHVRTDWDPEDEYDDPEPSVAARRPYSDVTLPGYHPPSRIIYPEGHGSDQNAHSQTMITVESDTGGKKFINENICPMEQRRSFILVLAKALLQLQAPSHRIENQLEAAARVLEVPAEFLHLPSLVIVSFGSLDGENGAPAVDKPRKFSFSSNKIKSAIVMAVLGKSKRENTGDENQQDKTAEDERVRDRKGPTQATTFGIRVHIVKSGGKMELGKLHELHKIYRKVVHDEISAQDGRIKLLKLLKQPPIYSIYERCAHAFLCGLLICVMSFGGSFIDMWVAGAGCATIAYLQLGVASGNPLYSNIFEISAAMMMSFIARGLSSINGHLFCYSAISSASVVLILPGSIVLSSSLELASRSLVSGSVKMVYAIVYSLFLGFSLTIGSDLYYLVDQSARPRIAAGMANVTDSYDLPGIFTGDNGQVVFSGAFTFLKPAASVTNTVKYVSKGCTRRVDGPWYLRQLPIWTLLVLVPLYSIISSMWKLQPFLSKQLPVMVFISCCSYAANKAANRYIFNRSDIVSAIGAFVTGILGNAYARIFRGTAYTAMVTAVGFLVPSGIAAAGGLAQTYENSEGDQYSTGLALGFRMVQVAIGCTVGLFGAGVVVYSFGSTKRSGYFAF
ncbi:unnamed protein product [Rhizoctonia solani]|uniref:Threonine/serine exporter-like N-terminal domain-containing protein n=1 Tax=Rhizoctonia solani TaxID=456999 RepID=A0A8H3CDZ5_9AGAM|nr:unnamed protein product [Rhizoctonia solani]